MPIKTSIIRVDASPTIGGGHLARCLLIAKKMITSGWGVRFVTAEKQAKDLIERSGYFCEEITKKEKIPSHLIKKGILTVIIADINSNTIFDEDVEYKKYINILHQQADLLLTFEDMVDHPYPADIVVIPYCGAEKLKIDYINKNTKYLLGPKYFPLRDEFKCITTNISNKVRKIVITMGGSDPEKITLKVLKALNNEIVESDIMVIVGGMSEISDQDIKNSSSNIVEKITIRRGVSNIAELIANSDLAFTNSGLTKYEISALGIPTIIISNTIQHVEYSELFVKNGSAVHLGAHAFVESSDIINAYNDLNCNLAKRINMFKKSKLLFGINGSDLIYNQIKNQLF